MSQRTKNEAAATGFWSGFVSIFSLFGVQRWPTPPRIANRGFLSDWMALSQDFRRVVDRFEEGRADGRVWAEDALAERSRSPQQHRA